jgi:tetratricopeptide (TPR) repeat protein
VANPSVRLFLSCVSDEFRDYRDALRGALTRPNVEVKIHEDFKALGGDTLGMLEDYIGQCEAVVHFVGDMAGSTPAIGSVDDLLQRRPDLAARLAAKGMAREALESLTYTQWEAWFAVGFGKDLLIVAPAESARGSKFAPTGASRASQAEHLKRLKAIDRYPGPPFTGADNLVAQIVNSAVIDALVKARALPARQPRNLPFASLGELFKGRERALEELRAALEGAKGVAVAGRALHGLGGIGKTRLAIEYAWARAADYSALLFVRADDAATLNAGLAALAGAEVLDLPEKEAREDEAKIAAVLHWLEAHPTWLLILDNVDDRDAVAAVASLMPKLKGGRVVVTGRAANFPGAIRTFELDALDEDAATQFLLDRTEVKREAAKDDAAQARTLAHELGGLALGLEQAGAHIATERIGFARYLKLWNESRDKVLAWADATLTGSDKTLATTWATSVARLSPESRRLLDRLAILAPDPIPNALIDVAVPGEAAGCDAYEARKGLYAYSLATQAKSEDGATRGFVVHRLVQDFARRAMTKKRRAAALREALDWINAAVPFDADDVRTWPVLDPLAPHALAVGRRADEVGIAEPTARLFNQLAMLFDAKARYAEAEPLYRRALKIDEASHGPDHPNVATDLGNLAQLLRATNRLAEAEPPYRRALKIDEASYGPDHPDVARDLNNLAELLNATDRRAEAEPLYRRALEIVEASQGPDHPNVASALNNLAQLLQATNRLAEAEPLMRRALAIGEASYGPDHPDVARYLNNLANLLQDANRLAEAEPLMRRALAIDETSLGPDHPYVAIRLNNLASLVQATNRLAEAEPLYRRASKIDEATYGPDHPNVARDLGNLAGLLQVTNRLGEAEPLMRRALEIDEASYGPDHPNVAQDLGNLAGLLQDTNRLGEAEPLMRHALAIDEASFEPDHPIVANRLNNLAGLLRVTNRPAEAEPLFRRALAILERSLEPDHPNVATVLNNLAFLLKQTSRLAEAEPLFRRALAILEASLGGDHPYAVSVRRTLGALEAARGPSSRVERPKRGFFGRLFGQQ